MVIDELGASVSPTRDAEAMERDLHGEFDGLRRFAPYMRGAEWCKPASELLKRIEEIATKSGGFATSRVLLFGCRSRGGIFLGRSPPNKELECGTEARTLQSIPKVRNFEVEH